MREEWRQSDCRITEVGALCPTKSAEQALSKILDHIAITSVSYPKL
ncbi:MULTISPECIES: hypothetical protein [Pantoea]|nr:MULTISPECIES: hypothetical protein [Pantoea]MDU5475960.1 hypothetical protein [Pantoea sp.]WBV24274.1 hypothetical protein PG877_23110 [Pantoea piersonii]